MLYSGVMSFVLLKIIGAVMPLRANASDETSGMDLTRHGEEAYVQAEGSSVAMVSTPSQTMGAAYGFAESHIPAR